MLTKVNFVRGHTTGPTWMLELVSRNTVGLGLGWIMQPVETLMSITAEIVRVERAWARMKVPGWGLGTGSGLGR